MSKNWKERTLAITGLNAADNPAPGVAVSRSLREAGHVGKLVGLAYDTMDAGLYNRDLFDEIYLIPFPTQGPEALMDRLRAIQEQAGIDAILPTLDSEMDLYLHIYPELQEIGIGSFLPEESGLALRAKSRLAEFCDTAGIGAPESRVVFNMEGLRDAWHELEDETEKQPVYIKGIFYDAKKAWSVEDAEAAFTSISTNWGLPIIVQRGLPGFEYNVCCLGDGKGGLIGSVPMRKLGVTEKGKAWSGVTVCNDELKEFSERIIRKLAWRGPCELEVMCVEGTEELVLIEINPRFPAWCYLCVGAGVNLPAAQAELACGQQPEELAEAKSGVIYSRMAMDIICDLNVLESLSVSGHAVYHKEQQNG